MVPVTRPMGGRGRRRLPDHVHPAAPKVTRTPMRATPRVTGPVRQAALQQSVPGAMPYSGMDPSDPSTYIRPWNPQAGMIGRLNYDGAQVQGNSDMGGLWSNPASWNAKAGRRPKRRPR